MGNATTFPLQSLVFLGFALAATLLSEGKLPTAREIRKLRGRVQVYGDDIIVPSHAYPFLVDALGYFDLKVNFGKSFPTGNFRESCGLDAFRGEDVTPAYIRSLPGRSPEAFTSTLDTMNQLWLKGWWNLSETMGSVLELNKLPIRGPDDDVVGLVSFSGRTESHLAKRWNSTLQRLEVRRLTANAKRKTVRPEGYQGLLRFLTERSLEKPSRLDFISPRGRVELDLEKPRLILQSKWVTTSL
jgi:hypothetical protein